MLSQRTQQYVQALVHGGDSFSPSAWLNRVREEEAAESKRNVPVALDNTLLNKTEAPESVDTLIAATRPKRPIGLTVTRPALKTNLPRRRSPRNRGGSVDRRISEVEAAWTAMKRKSRRNAIYSYLATVFDLVMEYKGRRRRKKLVRCVATLVGLPVAENIDPFAIVIRCTCDGGVDRKTISRWSRALRYVANRKDPETPLKEFMIRIGGVNACAERFARELGRKSRRDYLAERSFD